MINSRRAEARKSILVQVQSEQSAEELYSFCTAFGSVTKMFHYVAGVEKLVCKVHLKVHIFSTLLYQFQHFIIVEFLEESHVKSVLSSCVHQQNQSVIPVHSNFVWFRACNRKTAKLKQVNAAALNMENGNFLANDNEINKILKNCDDVGY